MNAQDLQNVRVRLLRIAAILAGGVLVVGSVCSCVQDDNWNMVTVTVHFDPDMSPDPPGSSEYPEIALETDGTDMSTWTDLDYYAADPAAGPANAEVGLEPFPTVFHFTIQ